jgi:hypothetical protein
MVKGRKRLHWTKTAEGRRRLRERKAAKLKERNNAKAQDVEQQRLWYAVGRVQGFLQGFAEGNNIAAKPFTDQVASILLSS